MAHTAERRKPRVLMLGGGGSPPPEVARDCDVTLAPAGGLAEDDGRFDALWIDVDGLGGVEPALATAAALPAGRAPALLVSDRADGRLAEAVERGEADGVVLRPLRPGELAIAIALAADRRAARARADLLADEVERVWSAPVTLFALLDRDLRVVRVNEAFARNNRMEPADFVGKRLLDLFPDTGSDTIFHEVVEEGRPFSERARPYEHVTREDPGLTYWDWSVHPIRRGDGPVEQVVLAVADATERVRASSELTRVQAQQDLTERLARVGSWELRIADGAFVGSASLAALLGEELTGLEELCRRIAAAERDRFREQVKAAAAGEREEVALEVQLERADGEVRDLATRATLVRYDDGAPRLVHGIVQDVTEQRRVERRLRESERGLLAAQRVARMGSWEWEIASGHLVWSQEIYAILDQDPRTFVPTYEAYQELVHPEDRARFTGAVERSVVRRERYSLDHRIVTPSGDVRWVHAEGEVSADEADEPIRMVGMFRDITDVRRAEGRARGLARIVETSLNEIYVFEAEALRFLEVNQAGQANLGYTLEELRLMTPLDIKPLLDAATFDALLDRLEPGGRDKAVFETVHQRKDGSRYDVEVHLQRSTFEGSEAFVATILDVTDRRVASEQLAQSEARLLEAQRIGRMGHWEWAVASGELYWSDQVYRIFGYEPQEMTPTYEGLLDAVHPDDRSAVEGAVEAALAGGDYDVVHRVLRRDGTVRWVHEQGVVFRDSVGLPVRFVGTVQDVTDLRRAQESVRTSEQRFRTLFVKSPIGISIYDADALLIVENAAAREIFRDEGGLNARRPFPKRLLPEGADERLEAGEPVSFDTTLERGDEPVHVRVNVVPTHGAPGVDAYFLLAEDVTAQVAAESRLRDSLREKDVLLKEVHHRVKNNLQVITALLKLQSRDVQDAAAQALFATAQERVASMAAVHEELYSTGDMGRVEVSSYAERIAKGLLDSYRLDGVALEVELGGFELGVDQAVPCGLIVNELVSNALKHAFPDSRTGTVRLVMEALDDGRLELVVADTGVGTSDLGALAGERSLGMQLVHNLARQLQGSVDYTSGPEGTEFRIRFHKLA